MQADFLIEDEGDGWWQCPSPLECFIVDGPREVSSAGGDFCLVLTHPAIRWRVPPALLIERFGPDHRLNGPFDPTNLALVTAVSRTGSDFRSGGWGGPAYPVDGDVMSVAAAQAICRNGAKVRVAFPPRDP